MFESVESHSRPHKSNWVDSKPMSSLNDELIISPLVQPRLYRMLPASKVVTMAHGREPFTVSRLIFEERTQEPARLLEDLESGTSHKMAGTK